MKNKRMFLLVSSLILASLLLASCGTAASDPGNFPTGTFIKSGQSDHGLVFNADKTFSVFQGGITIVTGTYSVDGKIYTETSNEGGCETNVSFEYVFDGKNLTFKYVGNPDDDVDCAGRRADFNNVTYVLEDSVSIAPEDSVSIAQKLWNAMNAKDLDATMTLMAENVQCGGGCRATGKAFLESFMTALMKGSSKFEISDLKAISDDTVTYSLSIYNASGYLAARASDLKMLVTDGKIALIEFP